MAPLEPASLVSVDCSRAVCRCQEQPCPLHAVHSISTVEHSEPIETHCMPPLPHISVLKQFGSAKERDTKVDRINIICLSVYIDR